MSDNSKGGKKYTVDEILAEYGDNQNSEVLENEDEPSETEAAESDIKVNSVLENIKPADTFSAEIEAAEDDFSVISEDNKAEPETELHISAEDIEAELWAESVEVSADASDEGTFSEELEEELVSPDETTEEELSEEETAEIIADSSDEPDKIDDDNADIDENNSEDDADVISEIEASEVDDNVSAVEDKVVEKAPFMVGFIPWKGDSIAEIIRKIVFIIAVCVFIGAGIMLGSTLIQSRKALNDKDSIKEQVTTTAATTIDGDGNIVTVAPTEEEQLEHNFDVMAYYKDINEDVMGFMELEGCDIYQPVVQGEDNNYYLTHTYYDGTNKAGSIFLDYRCRIEEDYTSPNLVVYGHNQEDGTMFGNLKEYKQNLDFYAQNPTVTFNTEYGIGTYLIYGFFVTNVLENQDSNGEVFHYQDYIETMNDEYTFNWYLNEVQDRNQIISPVDVQYGDQLLCLSTCSNEFSNSRFVVFARKLRADENVSDYDFTEARMNPKAKGVDWDAIMSGETSAETEEEITSAEETEETSESVEETGETTEVVETSVTTEPTTTAETSKTKRVDRTKKTTTVTTEETTVEAVITDENGETVTSVPETESETTTETAGSN